ncbi:unnamed protein product [Closterium sp. NIES-65]|nr:unnamed protein product [Closterium sp. NIES-65]
MKGPGGQEGLGGAEAGMEEEEGEVVVMGEGIMVQSDQTSGQFALHEGFQQLVQKTSQQPPQEAPHGSQLPTESTRKEFVTMPLETHMNGDGTPAKLPGASDQFSPTSKLKKRRTSLHHGLRPGAHDDGETVEGLSKSLEDLLDLFESSSSDQVYSGSPSILQACLKDRPTNRAKAMKALSMVVEVDPSILALDKVRKAVEDRFLDVSVSVREAAIDLVGKHIIGYPEIALKAQEGESDEFAALPFVMALQAFCEVDATLCTPPVDPSRFATTLLPYLTTTQDDRSNGDVKPRERLARLACLSESIVRVIAGILAHLRRPPSSLVTDLDQVLACLIISSSFMNLVHVSIRCLCTLQIVSPRPLKSFQLLVPRFYRALTNPNESKFHWRSLFALGLLCRYGGNEIEALEPSLPIPSILTVFKSFLSSPEEELQQRALQALGFAFIARPQEMVTEDAAQIFGNALHMEAPSKHKVQVLRSFQEYLTDVEEKMVEQNRRNLQTEAAAKKAQDAARHQSTGELQEESAEGIGAGGSSSATGVVPVAAGAGDTNVCSGVIQQHWEAILQCCMDMDPDVRQTALKLVEIVLNQGLVLPVTCVPQLIALQVDPDETTWKTSHHLLSLINDRWGNYRFIENRFTDGMRLAYGFMRALSGHPTNTQSNPAIKTPTKADPNSPRTTSSPATHAASAKLLGLAREGLGRVYKLIRGNRSSRNNILLSILRKFDCVDASSSMSNKLGSSTPTNSPSTSRAHQEPPSSYSVTPSGAFDIYFLAFCAQVIATFPFALPDEPLFLVHHISRVAHMRGGSLHSSIKYLFRPSSPLGPSVTSAVKAIEEEQAARCGNAYRITEEEEDDEEAGGSQPIEITIPEGASCCGNDQQEQQAFLDGALRRLKVSWEMASWYLEGRVTRVFDT